MATQKNETYNNLIDICIEYELHPDFGGKMDLIFRKIISDYFFKDESHESKSMEQFFDGLETPPFLGSVKRMYNIDMDQLAGYVNGETINTSLSGKIMLSKIYLKTFYPQQTPSFNHFPEELKFQLLARIKEKNSGIIDAFRKMKDDREAGRNRKIITLISLILKNIHMKSGRPFNTLQKTAEEIIRSIFSNAEEIFAGSGKQMSALGDDMKAKELVKAFFQIRQFRDIDEIAKLYRAELERYRKRSLWSV